MKYAIFIILFFFLPLSSIAATVSECEPGTVYCLCPSALGKDDVPQNRFDPGYVDENCTISCDEIVQFNAQRSCDALCDDLSSTTSNISAWEIQCIVDGTLTNAGFGEIGSEKTIGQSFEDARDEFFGEELNKPVLGVQIPGLQFSDPKQRTSTEYGYETKSIASNFLGEYIQAIYGWLIAAGAMIAIVLIMVGGLEWMLSAGNPGRVTKAKERINHALVGIVLLLSAYSIAYLIDPSTVMFETLDIQQISNKEYFPPEGEYTEIVQGRVITGTPIDAQGENIIFITSDKTLHPDASVALQQAAAAYNATTGKSIIVTSATRDLKRQAELFYDQCLGNPGRACNPITCNPAAGSSVISGNSKGYTLTGSLSGVTNRDTIISTLVANSNLANCPHTSTIAVDVWCNDGGGDWTHNPQCQYEIAQAMNANGWCRIVPEPWHFELQTLSVSRGCSPDNLLEYTTSSGTHKPDLSCDMWDYKNHTCK